MKTKICHAAVLTMDGEDRMYGNGYVLFEGNRILEAGPGEGPALPPGEGETVDGEGGILMPGMVNVHSHIPMIPFRSMGDDCPDRLRRFLFPLEREAMTPELVYLSSRYAVCELLLAGVTTVLDMYYFEDRVAEACDAMGIRAWVGQTVLDAETCDSRTPRDGLALCEELIRTWNGHARIRPVVAPHAANTVSPEILKAAHELAVRHGIPYTLHVSEMDYEAEYFRKEYGRTPIGFLYDLGVLGPGTIAAHCIHATEEDIALLAATGTKVAHCAGSNTKAGKGICPVKEMMEAGVTVGAGTDGPASGNTLDLFTQMRMIACFQKTRCRDRSVFPAKELVRMATIGGAAALGAEKEIGSIEPGKKADLVLVETKSVNMFPAYNPYSVLVYSANASNVDSVWVDGCRLVCGGRLLYADPDRIRAELAGAMTAFTESASKYREMI